MKRDRLGLAVVASTPRSQVRSLLLLLDAAGQGPPQDETGGLGAPRDYHATLKTFRPVRLALVTTDA